MVLVWYIVANGKKKIQNTERKNFPGRKMRRQMKAAGCDPDSEQNLKLIAEARKIKTKKKRG